jgi:TolB-like protein/Flp pilus assembly protein TadD
VRKLQDQAFEVLLILLREPGTVVTREELRKALWSDGFVDFEHGLNRIISRLRATLGDSISRPKYIQTIARHGYRFIAPLETVEHPSSGPLRLVVLPFANLSDDPAQEFFSDGMTEEMIAQLGQLQPERLKVIARTSAMQYKGSPKTVDQIGHELQVNFILEGSVRRLGDRVRITAQLIVVDDQSHLWCETYDREVRDLLSIQSDVASRVRRSLASELLPEKSAVQARIDAVDQGAYDAYMRGRYFWSKRHEGGLRSAIEWFERAIQNDSRFALAHSALSDAYALLSWYGEVPPVQAGNLARSFADRAFELDPQLGEAHASVALVRFWYEWDWQDAEKEFKRALKLSPNYAAAHQWFASYLITQGRFDEASREFERACDLDPLSLIIVQSAGDPHFYAGRYEEAAKQYQKTIEMNSEFAPAHFCLGRAYEQMGMLKEAVAEFRAANALSGRMEAAPAMAHALALMGMKAEAKRILQGLLNRNHPDVPALPVAMVHLGLGNTAEAVEWIEKAFEQRSFWLVYLNVDPTFHPIRRDPHFQSMLSKLHFAAGALAA